MTAPALSDDPKELYDQTLRLLEDTRARLKESPEGNASVKLDTAKTMSQITQALTLGMALVLSHRAHAAGEIAPATLAQEHADAFEALQTLATRFDEQPLPEPIADLCARTHAVLMDILALEVPKSLLS